ncbi:MAG: hypothetical protein QOE43_1813 [Gaiellaceae bacterium]|jgi:hypothetical protein|nr:hypothetical protein [Gaiellaceae bacterium]
MRRLSVILGLFTVIAVPAAALAAPSATGDGSLVVQNGSAPAGTPVVQLTITGSVIGHVDHGRIIIDTGVNGDAADVLGAEYRGDSKVSDTAQVWKGYDFKFRAVGGKNMVVLIYGSGVDLVAIGKGTVRLAGVPDTVTDGKYSLNGADFLSLPGTQTDKRTIGSNG